MYGCMIGTPLRRLGYIAFGHIYSLYNYIAIADPRDRSLKEVVRVCGDCPKILLIRGPIFRFLLLYGPLYNFSPILGTAI